MTIDRQESVGALEEALAELKTNSILDVMGYGETDAARYRASQNKIRALFGETHLTPIQAEVCLNAILALNPPEGEPLVATLRRIADDR